MKKLALYISSTHMPQKADWLSCVTVAADAGFDGLELFGARYAREADMAPDQLDAIARAARARNLTLSGHPWSECNYRISENADISTVCWQSARGIYSKISK